MALNIKDDETDRLAREVADLTGETLTEAIRASLEERLRHVRLQRGERPWDDAAIAATIASVRELPVYDARTADEIIGYDEHGVPR